MQKFFIAILLSIFVSCSSHKEISFEDNWDTQRVLENPHKGWYHHLLDNGINKYAISNDSLFLSFPGMDHLYLRLAWSYLEPEEGKFDWHYIDDVVDKYVSKGYGISFRISCKETGPYPGSVGQEKNGIQYATPYWVVKAGAKGIVAGEKTKSWTPDWDDPVYLEKLDNFHRAFAERYDGKPWLRYVDVGSIGEWGEGHTFFSTKIPPTVQEVKTNIDIYLKNYKKSPIVVTDDLLYFRKPDSDAAELYKYATDNGISLRDDSPMVKGYIEGHFKTWTISHPQFYDPLYLTMPIVFELEHYSSVKRNGYWKGQNGADTIEALDYSGADILRNAMKVMHPTYIGYHGYAEEWLKDNPELTKELANLCGYWYFPVKVTMPKKITGEENTILMGWTNKGLAPAYNKYGLVFRLASGNSEPVDIFIDDSGNLKWLSDTTYMEEYSLTIPPGTKGKYDLKFKLIEQDIDIQTGVKNELIDEDGFVFIGKVRL